MDPKTRDHLIAERNRRLAQTLLSPAQAGLEPAPWEWVAVILFYSAVHYVNAYLWERYGREPSNHGERTFAVRQDVAIHGCRQHYDYLRDVGYRARYDETFALAERTARTLLQVRLRAVEATVLTALGEQTPAW
jgi:hypothetical protein